MNTAQKHTNQYSKSAGSRWYAEQQQLHIDLQPLLGDPATLILSGWDAGIYWNNVIDGESTVYNDPFGEPPFPIEFFGHDILKPWVATIPDNVIALLKRYKGNAFGMLMLVNRYPYLKELFEDHPALFWLAHTFARDQHWNEGQFVTLCNRKRTEILSSCGLPGTSSAVKLLRKIQAKYFNRYTYDLIRELFCLADYAILNHRPTIPIRLIALLNLHPPLLYSRFIFNWEEQWSAEEYHMIDGIIRMVSSMQLGDYVNYLDCCRNLATLKARHDRLVKRMNELYRRQFRNEIKVKNVAYLAPPIAGNDFIVPILDSDTLNNESQRQQHCVAAYHGEIMLGRYYVYKILEPERATLGITILKMKNGQVSLRIDQLKGLKNQKVSDETERNVMAWFYEKSSSEISSTLLN